MGFSVSRDTKTRQRKDKYSELPDSSQEPAEEIDWVSELVERVDVHRDTVESLIEDKKQEYGGLVTLDSAAAILVGKDRGIDLVSELGQEQSNALKIENIVPGMKSVEIEVLVDRVQSTNKFDGGAVRNIVVEDETGRTQVTVWNDDVDAFDHLEPGDVVRVVDGYTKDEVSDWQEQHFNGLPAVHLGDSSELIKRSDGNEVLVESD